MPMIDKISNATTNVIAERRKINFLSLIGSFIIENILSEIGDESQINAYMHKKAQAYYTTQNIKYQLPIIIFSAISGTGNFISSNFPDYSTIIILSLGGLSIFTSIISSVAQFLKNLP